MNDLVCQIVRSLVWPFVFIFYTPKEALRFPCLFNCGKGGRPYVRDGFHPAVLVVLFYRTEVVCTCTPRVTRGGDISRLRSDERRRDKLSGFPCGGGAASLAGTCRITPAFRPCKNSRSCSSVSGRDGVLERGTAEGPKLSTTNISTRHTPADPNLGRACCCCARAAFRLVNTHSHPAAPCFFLPQAGRRPPAAASSLFLCLSHTRMFLRRLFGCCRQDAVLPSGTAFGGVV